MAARADVNGFSVSVPDTSLVLLKQPCYVFHLLSLPPPVSPFTLPLSHTRSSGASPPNAVIYHQALMSRSGRKWVDHMIGFNRWSWANGVRQANLDTVVLSLSISRVVCLISSLCFFFSLLFNSLFCLLCVITYIVFTSSFWSLPPTWPSSLLSLSPAGSHGFFCC